MHPYSSKRDALLAGVKDAFGAPAVVLFAGMVGFGAMGRMQGLDLWFTGFCSVFMFALPGQVVLMEMIIGHSALLTTALAVTLTSTRFVTMTLTLFPQFSERDKQKGAFAAVHLLAMTVWAVSMREFPYIKTELRRSYFVGFGLFCWLLALPGTATGYLLAGVVPKPITLALIFINPLFFVLTFTEVRANWSRIAIFLGCILGPIFYTLDPDSSLLFSGLIGGTVAYLFEREFLRKPSKNQSKDSSTEQ